MEQYLQPDMGRPIEILLVEDNEGDIILTKKAFERGKIINKLHVCRNGKEALDFLYKRNGYEDKPTPNMILLDLNMPIMGGQEVLEKIKNEPELMTIPVIVLTTSNADEDIIKSYALHCSSYIRKPVDFKQFGAVIQTLQDYWFTVVKFPVRKD